MNNIKTKLEVLKDRVINKPDTFQHRGFNKTVVLHALNGSIRNVNKLTPSDLSYYDLLSNDMNNKL